jgi:cytochrome P450
MQSATIQPSRGPDAQFVLNMDDPEFIKNPYPAYRYLREHAPVYDWAERMSLVFSRYHDVRTILTERDFSTNINDWEFAQPMHEIPGLEEFYYQQKHGFFEVSEADHVRIRKLASGTFTPRSVEMMRQSVQAVIDRALARCEGKETINFRNIVDPIPLQVIGLLLKIPQEMEEGFRALGHAVSKNTDMRLTPAERVELLGRFPEWMAMLRSLIGHREQHPLEEDFLTTLIAARDQGSKLSEIELIALIIALITAGADTTVHVASNAIYNLLRHPDQLALLRQEPTRLRNAVEETMRFDHVIKYSLPRFALREMVAAGVRIRKGQMVYPLLPSALHDEAVFPEPGRLDIKRDLSDSMGFSIGPHFCMGAALARLELDLIVKTMLQRFPNLALASPPVYDAHPILRPMSELSLRLR